MEFLTDRRIPVRGILLAIAVLCALLLTLPGVTVITSYVNDLFIFLDGAHRITSGQVPNRDFHTALGPLSFYIPATGYWLSGTMGGAMPFGMAIVTLFLALPMAHVLGSRLRPVIAIPYGTFLLLIVAAPLNLGEGITELSFAMFYNRIGWASLGVLFAMYLQPRQPHPRQGLLDAFCAAALTLLMVYTKITYGLVALAFVAFLLLAARQRAWAAMSLALILASGLGIEAFWQASLAHFEDLRMTSQVSGSRGLADLLSAFRRNLFDYAILAPLAVLVLWRTRRLYDLIFFGFCTLPGLLIQTQNAQSWGIVTIHAGVAVAAEMLLRQEQTDPLRASRTSLTTISALLLSALILLPTLLHCFAALSFHMAVGVAGSGQAFKLPQFEGIRLISPWLSGKRTMMNDYLESIEDGARVLESLAERPEKVAVLDFSNPFSAGLDLPPPRGDSAWLHWGRNIGVAHFFPPERYFADVQIVMIPKWGINPIPLLGLYRTYLEEAYEPLQDTAGWSVYRRRERDVAENPSP